MVVVVLLLMFVSWLDTRARRQDSGRDFEPLDMKARIQTRSTTQKKKCLWSRHEVVAEAIEH